MESKPGSVLTMNSKLFPTSQRFTAHLESNAHTGVDHTCPDCLRIFKSPTALMQHMEATNVRCKVKESSQYAELVSLVTGKYVEVSGQHVDGTIKYEAAEPDW